MPMLNMLTRKLFSGRVGLGAAAPGTRRCVSRRQFSRSAFLASDIDASKLKVTANSESKPKPAKEDLVFGKEFTDHYLVIDYSEGKGGWGAPEIIPYGPMALAPSASVLHYALECFEGMKAYKDADGTCLVMICGVCVASPSKRVLALSVRAGCWRKSGCCVACWRRGTLGSWPVRRVSCLSPTSVQLNTQCFSRDLLSSCHLRRPQATPASSALTATWSA